MGTLRRAPPGFALICGLAGWACVVGTIGYAMDDATWRAALALIVGGLASSVGIAIAALGRHTVTGRHIVGRIGLLANAIVLASVVTLALVVRW
jgi:hypothetical protein